MDKIECPKCGREYHKRGLSKHKNSQKCRYYQKIKENPDDEKRIGKKIKNWLEKNDKPVYYRPVNYNWGRILYGYKAKEEDIQEAKKHVLPNYSGNGMTRTWYKKEETEKHLIVEKDRDNTLQLYKKDEPGKTRKRKFLTRYTDNQILYNNNGERYGEKVQSKENIDNKIQKKLVALQL